MSALLVVVLSVSLLILLIVVVRLPAFVSLLVAAFFAGIAGGVPFAEIPEVVREGMGATLGYVAIVVGLGALFAAFLEHSGAAQSLASDLVRRCGERSTPWALMLTGMVVATPVFFDVAFILLVPLVYRLSRTSGRPVPYFAFPLLAGMAASHVLVPPTPGPVAVAGLLEADLGWVILLGAAAGLPAAVLSGVWFGSRIVGGMQPDMPPELPEADAVRNPLRAGQSLALIAFPLVLILTGTFTRLWTPEGDPIGSFFLFLGHPFVALSLVVLLCIALLGPRIAADRDRLQEMLIRALEPTASIVLLTGAGGAFGRMLVRVGAGDQAAELVAQWELPVLLVGFLLAAAVRISQGSATVAMVTAAGILAPILAGSEAGEPLKAAAVVAIGCGATVVSHFNDSGFWLVGRYLGLSTRQTLASWTIMETLLGVTGFLVVCALSLLF